MNEMHLRVANTQHGGYALLCLHCGDMYVPALPISIDMMISVSESFATSHRNCEKPVAPYDQNLLLMSADILHLRNVKFARG